MAKHKTPTTPAAMPSLEQPSPLANDTRVLAMKDAELQRFKDRLQEMNYKGAAISGICTVLDKISTIKCIGEQSDNHHDLWSEISTENVTWALHRGIDSLTREITTESEKLYKSVCTWEKGNDHE